MKRVLTGSFLAAAFAVGLSAQTTPPQTTPPPTTPPTSQSQPPMQESRDRDAKSVTVTGCLKAGDSADSFMLSDLKWGNKDKGTGAVGTSGTAAPPAAIASATSLKIVPSGSTKLSEHVGPQVEVTGSVSDKSSSPTAPPADRSTLGPHGVGDVHTAVRAVRLRSAIGKANDESQPDHESGWLFLQSGAR